MYTATFIFEKKHFDEEFHRLDALIAEAARQTEGYLGEEVWENPENGRTSTVYYWSSESGLRQLMENTHHLEAKHRHAEWLSAYRVEIAQVIKSYGDGLIPSPGT